LYEGPREGEKAGGVGLVEAVVSTAGDAQDLLGRCREVLRTVLDAAREEWPSDEAWSEVLPSWFVQGCAAEASEEEAAAWLAWWRGLDGEARARATKEAPWTLAQWIHWLHPDERQWYWWNGVVYGRHEVRILIEVPGWPGPLGAFEWLLRVAGADSVEVMENQVR
jgi:hypothetical protein